MTFFSLRPCLAGGGAWQDGSGSRKNSSGPKKKFSPGPFSSPWQGIRAFWRGICTFCQENFFKFSPTNPCKETFRIVPRRVVPRHSLLLPDEAKYLLYLKIIPIIFLKVLGSSRIKFLFFHKNTTL